MARVTVEVVYALAQSVEVAQVRLAPGSTLHDAVSASGILRRHPEIDLARQKLGVFGTVKSGAAPVADGDRIEISRALAVEPREARRRRAARARRASRTTR